MNQIGRGVYQLDQTKVAQMPCTPKQLQPDDIAEMLNNPEGAAVVIRIIMFCRLHGVWVGMEMDRLAEGLLGRGLNLGHSIQGLVRKGWLFVPKQRTGWLSFLNYFSPRILCPTPMLVGLLWQHQTKLKRKSGQ